MTDRLPFIAWPNPPANYYTHRARVHRGRLPTEATIGPIAVTAMNLSIGAGGELRTTVTVRTAPMFLAALLGSLGVVASRRSRGWRRHIRRLKAARRRSS